MRAGLSLKTYPVSMDRQIYFTGLVSPQDIAAVLGHKNYKIESTTL